MTRKILNISLIALVAFLLGIAIFLVGRKFTRSSEEIASLQHIPDNALQADSLQEEKIVTRDLVLPAEKGNINSEEIPSEENVNPQSNKLQSSAREVKKVRLRDTDIRSISRSNPLYAEARKVLSGNLEESDSLNRRQILGYCEHLRQSYQTKDIDFIRQVFSDDALIIVGHVVQTDPRSALLSQTPKVRYSIRSKTEYLNQLVKVFAANKKVQVDFSDFKILRHPSKEGIYGVTLHQKYASDRYSDDGYLFLLWDFRDPSMPKIHVRTWQPRRSISSQDDLIEIGDFNLE